MKKSIILCSLLIVALIACDSADNTKLGISGEAEGNASDFSNSSETIEASYAENEEGEKVKEKKKELDRKIIWKAQLTFQVRNVDSSTTAIQQVVKDLNGFVSGMKLSSTNNRINNTIIIRVKNDRFNEAIQKLKVGALYVDEMNVESNDVTEEFIDIQSRLKTKKDVRERYIELLRNKAGSVKDVIEAEEAIRKITEEIEAKEGRLRYLSEKVDYSTITITIYEKVHYQKEPEIYEKPYHTKLVQSLQNGWSIVTSFVLFMANIWPLLLLIILLIWKWEWIKKILRL